MYWLRLMREGGWLIALAVALLALFVAWLAYNPVEEGADHVLAPVARSVGILPSLCKSGWEDVSSRDEHTRISSCKRDGWLVVLDEDGKFQHGVELDTPGATFKFRPEEVPDW